jgi:hypothetical protein
MPSVLPMEVASLVVLMVDVARAYYIYYFDDVNCFALFVIAIAVALIFLLVQCHREKMTARSLM